MAINQRATSPPQTHNTRHGAWEEGIEGSFRPISTHQLFVAWWLHIEGHLTRKQLRVYFASHEMAERRRVAGQISKTQRFRPHYTVEEVAELVGSRRTASAMAELRSDIKHLKTLGLMAIEPHEIVFARSIDQITVGDASAFWEMFDRVPNGRRTVPVPRRTLRALAAGFSRAVTGVMLATLIRSLFWHKSTGTYRVDGRTKGSWVAEVFGISRRAVTDARATLIELGWLEPCDTPQWALNRWGAHARVNTKWCHREVVETKTSSNDNQHAGKSASPGSEFSGGSAKPDQTDSLPPRGNQNTRRLRHARNRSGIEDDPNRVGGSVPAARCEQHRRRSARPARRSRTKPSIHDVRPADLARMDRVLDLHHQAVECGLAVAGEGGRLDFVALAERARSRGKDPGAYFYWLLRERKTGFITQHEEDLASKRIKDHLYGAEHERPKHHDDGPPSLVRGGRSEGLTAEEWFVVTCVRIGKQHRVEPAAVAKRAKGWSQEAWDDAFDAFQRAQFERQSAAVMDVEL